MCSSSLQMVEVGPVPRYPWQPGGKLLDIGPALLRHPRLK